MTNTKHKSGKSMSAKALQVVTLAWAILGLAAILLTAAVWGDWDLNAFYFYLIIVFQFSATVYLSVLAILWELSRRTRRRAGTDLRDTPFTVMLHRLLLITAVAGLLTASFIPLILFDLLNGGFSLIHFAIGIMEAVLYATWGIYTVIRRILECRRTEQHRLEEEKQAWEGYLT